MDYLLIANLGQSEYSNLENRMTIQYSMKNNQYPKDLILASDIMKNNRHDGSGTRKIEHKTSKQENSRKLNKSGEKEEKAIEE